MQLTRILLGKDLTQKSRKYGIFLVSLYQLRTSKTPLRPPSRWAKRHEKIMIATIFDLFTGMPTMVEAGAAPAPHQVKTPVINPCKGCEFYGMCDTDDCGQNMSLLDLVSTRFRNLGEYITFMKRNGLL